MSTQEHTTKAVPPDSGLSETLQMSVVEHSPDRVVMTMPVTASHRQPWGYRRGDASITIVEFVPFLLMLQEQQSTTGSRRQTTVNAPFVKCIVTKTWRKTV